MQWLQLRESSGPERHALPDHVAMALNQLDIATLTPAGGGDWMLSNIRKVGVVRVADFHVTIHPKVPVARLYFLMGYALNRDFWLDDGIALSADNDSDLVNTIAVSFIRHAARATRQGLLQGYERYEESLPLVRGRLDIPAQIGRCGGLVFPAQVVFDEFTVDIAENRLLLSAARRLLKLPTLTARTRTDLRRMTQALDGVTPLAAGQPLPPVHFTRLNARYRPALVLADLILRNSSLEQDRGDVAATAFLFDMWRIFEDFVTTALSHALEDRGGTAKSQATGTYLDAGSQVALRPDLLWHDEGHPKAVIDAKYKRTTSANYPNADIYQMLAYCVRFGLETGHLVYAKGEKEPEVHRIIGHQAAIHCHAVDLNQHPSALLDEMSQLADRIVTQRKASLG
jgi:5-methylcytosine-specific restriction enzyme subunit McrC